MLALQKYENKKETVVGKQCTMSLKQ